MATNPDNYRRNKDLEPGVPPSSNNAGGFAEKKQQEAAGGLEGLSDERLSELMDMAARSARRLVAARGSMVSSSVAEDIASESLVQFVDACHKNPNVLNNPEAYLSAIIRNEASAATATVSKGARSGWAALNPRIQKAESILGRPLNNDELDAEGEALRELNPGKYPAKFWRQQNRNAIPLSIVRENSDESMQFTSAFDTKPDVDIDDQLDWEQRIEDKQFTQALLALQEQSRTSEMQAFRYNALAEGHGAPVAIPGSLPRRSERTAYLGMRGDHDTNNTEALNRRVLSAIDDFENGKDTEMTRHLFAPFGDANDNTRNRRLLSNEDKRKVADLIKAKPEAAWDMWHSSLTTANRSNYDRIMKVLWDENPDIRRTAKPRGRVNRRSDG